MNYLLLSTGYCEKVEIQSCDEIGYFSQQFPLSQWEDLIINDVKPGCRKCIQGYSALLMDTAKNFCVRFPSILQMDQNIVPFFTPFCQIYGIVNNQIVCQICRTDKIQTFNY